MTRVALGRVAVGHATAQMMTFDGTPYVPGGNTRAGTDCSGAIQQAGRALGIAWPRHSAQLIALARATHPLTMKQALATEGALLGKPGHVGWSLGNGRDMAVRSPRIRSGVYDASLSNFTSAGLLPGLVYDVREYCPVQLGDSGPFVRSVQAALRVRDFDGPNGKPLALDGRFGSFTEHAVIAFQTEAGLVPDGVAGPITQAALGL